MLADVAPRHSEVAMYSTALERVVSGTELDAGYWMANLRRPVCFASAVREMLADRTPALFLEISPHPMLPAIENEIDACGADAAAVPSLLRERAAEVLAAPPGSIDPAAPLHVAGMDSVLAGQPRVRLRRRPGPERPADRPAG